MGAPADALVVFAIVVAILLFYSHPTMIALAAWDAYESRVGAVAVLATCAISWWLNRRLMRLYGAATPNTEVDLEKGTVAERKEATTSPQPTIFIVWAAITLPLFIAAWCLPNIVWSRTRDLSTFSTIAHFFMGINPILASIQVLLCSFLLSRPQTPAQAEKFRVYMRHSMISAASMAPLSAVWACWVFPERFYGSALVSGGALAYALQGCVWMYFVRRSKRESEEVVRDGGLMVHAQESSEK